MEPAPYAGFMARTLDDEKNQKDLLKKQEVEVSVNGSPETLRPNAVHVRGVDNLSTQDIEAFVDLYLNWKNDNGYEKVAEVWFRVQWIDDSNANVIFKTHEDAATALEALAEEPVTLNKETEPETEMQTDNQSEKKPVFSEEYLSQLVLERQAKSYAASIEFHKYKKHLASLAEEDLFKAKKEEQEKAEEERATMDEDGSSVVLYIRMALQSDRKLKNASAYSRYYLLHGEPDRSKPRPRNNRQARGRGQYSRNDEDLFAHKLQNREEEEEDLFAHKLRDRSRSPGR